MSITIIEIVILLLVVAFVIYLVTPRSKFGNYTGLKEQISRDEYLDIVELLKEAKQVGFNLDWSDVSRIKNFYQGLNSRDFELKVNGSLIFDFENRFNYPFKGFGHTKKHMAIELFCYSVRNKNEEQIALIRKSLLIKSRWSREDDVDIKFFPD